MIEVIALGMAALALILGFMGTGGVSDLKRKLEDRLLFIEPRIGALEKMRELDRKAATEIVEKHLKAKTEVELEEIAKLKARMDALEAPKPTKKARRNSKGQYTKRAKS